MLPFLVEQAQCCHIGVFNVSSPFLRHQEQDVIELIDQPLANQRFLGNAE